MTMTEQNPLKRINLISNKEMRRKCEDEICSHCGFKKASLNVYKTNGLPQRYAYSPVMKYIIDKYMELEIKIAKQTKK